MAILQNTIKDRLAIGLLGLALFSFPHGSALAQVPSAESPSDASSVDTKAVPASQALPDDALADRLDGILDATGWFEGIRVGVRHGVISLDGVSDTAEHRSWAAELAGKMEGSVAVVNRLELRADFASTFDRAAEEVAQVTRRVGEAIPLIVLALLILAITWGVASLVAASARRLLMRRIPSPLLRNIMVRAMAVPVMLLGIYFVLQVAGLTRLAVTVLGGTGLVGIIVGFAFRDIAENFLASLLLSVRNPFRTGDLIEVSGATGIVQHLNTRSTVLLTLDGNHVQIPNATVYKSTIKNYSSTPTRRAEFMVGIGYDSSAALAQSLISNILKRHPAVLEEPEPLVLVDELGAATVNMRVSYWFDSRTYSPAKTNSALLRLTKNALLEAGIELPDPAREVVFPRGVPLTRMGKDPLPQMAPTPGGGSGSNADETLDATRGEGELKRESLQLNEKAGQESPEGPENLLND